MKASNVAKFLDARYRRVKQYSSADWGGCAVWDVKSNGITEGMFIHQDDDDNFTLLVRSEKDEETIIDELFTYVIGSGDIKKLLV
jgi:hypothetical protein